MKTARKPRPSIRALKAAIFERDATVASLQTKVELLSEGAQGMRQAFDDTVKAGHAVLGAALLWRHLTKTKSQDEKVIALLDAITDGAVSNWNLRRQ